MLPPATPTPCDECPWRRTSVPGWLGPHTASEWAEAAHGEGAIACHRTIREADEDGEGDWEHPAIRQCRGSAIFRANVHKLPRRPEVTVGPADHVTVFADTAGFLAHHQPAHRRPGRGG